MEFIKGPHIQGCIFCVLPEQDQDRENLILHRGKACFVILNKFPYNNGHLMIVPNFHTANYAEVSDAALNEMNQLTKKSLSILDTLYRPQGYNTGINMGEAAGAGVKGHLHLHIVPRWVGDTNFMPVLAETRCLPQHLMKCYDDMLPHFETTSR
jgi:ATP adenylyltransferase